MSLPTVVAKTEWSMRPSTGIDFTEHRIYLIKALHDATNYVNTNTGYTSTRVTCGVDALSLIESQKTFEPASTIPGGNYRGVLDDSWTVYLAPNLKPYDVFIGNAKGVCRVTLTDPHWMEEDLEKEWEATRGDREALGVDSVLGLYTMSKS